MKSDKKCEACGEFEEETVYARGMPEGENAEKANVVSQCVNYENCPKFKK